MATITLTITKDGTEADPDSGDHATVVWDSSDMWPAAFSLRSIADRMTSPRGGWASAFDVVKGVERERGAKAEPNQ